MYQCEEDDRFSLSLSSIIWSSVHLFLCLFLPVLPSDVLAFGVRMRAGCVWQMIWTVKGPCSNKGSFRLPCSIHGQKNTQNNHDSFCLNSKSLLVINKLRQLKAQEAVKILLEGCLLLRGSSSLRHTLQHKGYGTSVSSALYYLISLN